MAIWGMTHPLHASRPGPAGLRKTLEGSLSRSHGVGSNGIVSHQKITTETPKAPRPTNIIGGTECACAFFW